jgi:syntaxin 16
MTTIVTRDLTAGFLKFRMSHKNRKNRFGYSLLDSTPSPTGYSAAKSEIEMNAIGAAASSPSFPQEVQSIKQDMEKLKEKMGQLQKIQQKRLLKVFDDASGAATLGDSEIEAVGQDISRLFRVCESKVKRLGSRPAGASQQDAELARNAQKGLASALSKLNEETREIQRGFMKEVKRRQAMMGGVDDFSNPTGSLIDAAFTTTQAAALENLEAEAEQRSTEINAIAKSVAELNRLFKDLAGLVIDQGTILDRIDYNIENVQEQTKAGVVQLQRAQEQQKQGSAMKCIMILVVIIFLNMLLYAMK